MYLSHLVSLYQSEENRTGRYKLKVKVQVEEEENEMMGRWNGESN